MIFKIHKRNLINRFLVSLLGAALMTAAPLIHAERSYVGTWGGIYPASSSGDNAICALCHNSTTSGSSFNPYGNAIRISSAGSISSRIVDVESLDSDSDPTASDNITEINANAQPGWTGTAPTGVVGDLDPAGNQSPVADANGPYTGTVGVPLTLDGTGSYDPEGTIVAYDWDFGDGSTGSGAAPTHTYITDGSFVVSLTVTDDIGDTGTDTSTATIGLGNQPPVADPNGPYTGTVGVAVAFDGSASSDPDGSIISYSWDFGDGNTGTGATPSHTYASAGLYNVTLTVMDDAGVTDSQGTTADIIEAPVNQPPVSDPNGPYTGTNGVAVLFDGTGSSDPDGTIVAYDWDFGDGNIGTGPTPSHSYATDGNYTVSLNVTDDAGATDLATTTASIGAVNQPPVADPNGPYSGTVGIIVMFDGTGSNDPDGTIVAYNWDFGDGNTGDGATPGHTYAADGIYTVTLTVTDDAGDTGSATTTASIGLGNQPPLADPNGPYTGTVGVAVIFDGTGSSDPDGTVVDYNWDFGDGATGSGVNPSHTYASEGVYNVTLTVTDDAGATDSAMTTVTIAPETPVEIDLDIKRFSVTKKVSLTRGKNIISIKLTVENGGVIEGSALATVTGMQNGGVVYEQTLNVTDSVGNGSTRYAFDSFSPDAEGDIVWTVVIADDDPDDDVATGITVVNP